MPFTISHAAAALPLRRTGLPMAALMIGCMTPDFAYFLPWEPDRMGTHSIAGLFWFCWPVGLMAWVIFVLLLEAPTIALLPPSWRAGITRSARPGSPRSLALVSLAVILGAITHDVWDAFTHGRSIVVDRLPMFHSSVELLGIRFRLFYWLQIASSVLGLVALAWWGSKFRSPGAVEVPQPATPALSNRTRVLALAVMITMSMVLAIAGFATNADVILPRRMFHFLIGGMAGWALAWVGVAAVLQMRLKARSEA
jgi:hypothetical protein